MGSDDRVTCLSECFIKPQPQGLEGSKRQKCYLTPWDLAMLSVHYIQKGLLYHKPPQQIDMEAFLGQLKDSLAVALAHFYPLAGRLDTVREENPAECSFFLVYVDCDKGPGARFIHAAADLRVADVMEATYVPRVVQMLFDHDQCVNHEGHERALVSIQVTELVDGIFIGCSMNHCIGDGTSFWHFFNTWSEIFQGRASGVEGVPVSRPPVHDRWFLDGCGPIISLPYKHPEEFVRRHMAPELVERFFHFSAGSMARLKAKANAEANMTRISSFQALSALLWITITRARNFPPEQVVGCRLAANVRQRRNPPLSPDYFGNSLSALRGQTTSGKLLAQNLGWAARILHDEVANLSDQGVRRFLSQWVESPIVYQLGQLFDPYSVMMGSSPRFNMYGNEFGLGKAVGLRSGYANKFDGKVSSYPGYEGGGSVDLEVCLAPDNMKAFECDKELLDAMSCK
uniref:HXXXD-type acyl-transferase family protein n=1 Tax=Kalanchoe fedtschenkoi TaxID=63787 RepID=A0A7N0TEW1_KALFE